MSRHIALYNMSFILMLRDMFTSPLFLAPLSSLTIAQLIKGIIYLFKSRRKEPTEFFDIVTWRTGGMPSSHSALVCSLCTTIGISEGINSNIFVLSLWFAIVVLRDAVGVRHLAGLLSKSLNKLGKQTVAKTGGEYQPVKEIQGHTIQEVIAGGSLGIIIAACFGLFL